MEAYVLHLHMSVYTPMAFELINTLPQRAPIGNASRQVFH